MARTRNPFSRIVATKNDAEAAAAEAKAAAEKQLAESNTITHQGPGTGKAAPADPAAGSETLQRARDEAAAGTATATTATKTAADTAIRDAIQDAKDSAAQDPFDGIAAGRIPGAQETPTAVTDNDAESGGGESFGLSDLGLGRKGESIAVDDGVDDGLKTLTDNPFRSQIGDADPDPFAGGAQSGASTGTAGSNSAGSQAARDNLQSEIDSARGNEEDVASDLLGKPDVTAGAGNAGSGQSLFDLQLAGADLALAQASATETEPSVAIEQTTLKAVGQGLDTASGLISAGVAVAGLGGATPVGIAGSIGLAAGNAVGGVAGGGLTAGGLVAGVAAGTVAGAAIAGAAGFTLGTLAVKSGVADFSGAIDDIVTAGEETAAETEAKAAEARKQGEADKAAKQAAAEEEAANKKEIEEAEKAQAEADRKAAEEAEAEAAKAKGGGVSTTPVDDQRRPPTPEEFALQQAIKAELGLVRIAGDIDFGEGDGTNSGTASSANLSAVDNIKLGGNESLVGNPGSADAPTTGGSGTPGSPGFGGSDQGGDIDFEDGSGFTGGTRTEDPNDISFGPSAPVAGFTRDDEEDDDSSSSTTLTTRFTRTAKDSDDD